MAYSLRTDKSWAVTERDIRETFRKWGVTKYEVLSGLRGVQAARYAQDRSQAEVAVNFWHPGSGSLVPVTSRNQARAVDNLRVCWLALEALRMNEARGISEVMREAYLALPAPVRERDPWEVLGIRPDTPLEDAQAMYRIKAKRLHPDTGSGDEAAMKELNAAMERIIAEQA